MWPMTRQDRANGLFHRDSRVRMRDVTDGTSNTIAFGEVSWDVHKNARLYAAVHPSDGLAQGGSNRLMAHGQFAMNPPPLAPNTARAFSFHSAHEGGCHFAFADGSVRFVSENIQHTAFPWDKDNPFDQVNGGAGYGLYQRLFSRNDNLPQGEL